LYEAVEQPAPFAGGWQATSLGGEGVVWAGPEGLDLDFGSPLTAVHRSDFAPPDPNSYELKMRAVRVSGTDFFCALTFPIGSEEAATLVLGGWGGSLCGLSCIDGADAAQNQTKFFRSFAPGEVVQARLRVRPESIQVWLDDELLVDVPRAGHRFSLRTEMLACTPLGIASYQSTGRILSLEWRP